MFVVFQEIHVLTMMMFVGSQSFISLPSFMFVSAAVSEISKWNQNKKEKELKIVINNFHVYVYFHFFKHARNLVDRKVKLR